MNVKTIDINEVEKELLKEIDNNIEYIEGRSNVIILYRKERYLNELYISIRIYNATTQILLKHKFNKLENIYNYVLGISDTIKLY